MTKFLNRFPAPYQKVEKLMIQFQENARTNGGKDKRTDGRMEGLTDRPYFIGSFRLPPREKKINFDSETKSN